MTPGLKLALLEERMARSNGVLAERPTEAYVLLSSLLRRFFPCRGT